MFCMAAPEFNGNATRLFKLIFKFPVALIFFGGSFHPGVKGGGGPENLIVYIEYFSSL